MVDNQSGELTNSDEVKRNQSAFARMKAAARWVWDGTSPAETWFGPGQPMTPVAPEEVSGRVRDYANMANIQLSPRAEEWASFKMLYELADNNELIRMCIQTRKDQVRALEWTIRYRATGGATGEEIPKLIEFFEKPDRREPRSSWLGRILEDSMVGDCSALYARRNLKDEIIAWEPIDGSSILLRLDPWGRTPMQGAAYTQIIKGLPAVNYTMDELVYAPRNPRNHKAYGLGEVEMVLLTGNLMLKRQFQQLSEYTDGSLPNTIIGVPDTWQDSKIDRIMDYLKSIYRGNQKNQKVPWILPGGDMAKFINTKENVSKEDIDEWWARIICYNFNLPPTAFAKQQNRATAETAQEVALSEGLAPLKIWLTNLHNDLLTRMGHPEAEFVFLEPDSMDPAVRNKILCDQVDRGIITENEFRIEIGREPFTPQELEAMKPPPPVPPTPSGPEGNPPVPGEQDGVAPSPAPESPVKKSVKKKIAPIDRERPSILKYQVKLAKVMKKSFNTTKETCLALHGDMSKSAPEDPGETAKILANIYKDGAKAAKGQLGVSVALGKINNKAAAWAEEHAAELITGIDETTRNGIKNLVAKSMDEGWSPSQLSDALRDDYLFSDVRAEMIARTETAKADTQGNMDLYREAGVMGKSWLSDGEGCSDCLSNVDDGVIGFEDAFSSGDDAPPAHPQCRCCLVPELLETTEE